jgi:hypothetical protein
MLATATARSGALRLGPALSCALVACDGAITLPAAGPKVSGVRYAGDLIPSSPIKILLSWKRKILKIGTASTVPRPRRTRPITQQRTLRVRSGLTASIAPGSNANLRRDPQPTPTP